jgi:hypothetical protein
MVAARIANLPQGGNGSNQFSKTANLQISDPPQEQIFQKLPEVKPTTFGVSQSNQRHPNLVTP